MLATVDISPATDDQAKAIKFTPEFATGLTVRYVHVLASSASIRSSQLTSKLRSKRRVTCAVANDEGLETKGE
jgi:hypothetical protein